VVAQGSSHCARSADLARLLSGIAAAKHVTEVPEAAAWFTHISESRGIEHLTVACT
jgi:hypothetical protein